MVFTCDRPPVEIPGISCKFTAFMENGLAAAIEPYDLETRMTILRKKSESKRVEVPEDVIELIALKYDKSMIQMEGALVRVIAYSALSGTEINRRAARYVLKGSS